jgi:HEAT repeat protein
LLAELGDPQAIPVLVPLLKDADLNYKIPWVLGELGDKRAVGPLLDVLDDESPMMRVAAIDALVTLHAKEALPHLIPLLNDDRNPHYGTQVSVADAARVAIENLQ